MIKVVAFDLVGVLVFEKRLKLSKLEERLERMFGPNLDDNDYLDSVSDMDRNSVIAITKEVIDKLYYVSDCDIFKKIKDKYPDIKILIATNHLSYVRDFINNNFNVNYLDDLIISSEIHRIKPNRDFYKYIIDKYDVEPQELLFIDDNINNIDGARDIGIKTIKIDREDDVLEKVLCYLDNKL